jgi:transcriptional regulator with XRE-family HTH domain
MVRPDKMPPFVRELTSEAKRQRLTGYKLAKDAGIPLSTAQRFLAGNLNPTASTLESIARSLGVAIRVERK